MSFMAGFIAGLSEGGTAVKSDIIDKILALPIRYGGTFGSDSDGYHYMLHYGDVGQRGRMLITKYNTSVNGDGEFAYFANEKVKPGIFWFVLHKNTGNDINSVVFAAALANHTSYSRYDDAFAECYDYSTRANGEEIEWWLYEKIERHINNVQLNAMEKYAGLEWKISFKVYYTDVDTYYKFDTGEIERQTAKSGEYVIPSFNFVIPASIMSTAFYSNLSDESFEQEMLKFAKKLDQLHSLNEI